MKCSRKRIMQGAILTNLADLANISAPDMHITTGLLQLNALQKEKHYER